VPHPGGVGRKLPLGRRQAVAAIGVCEQVDRVLRAHARILRGIEQKLRIESDIRRVGLIVELHVAEDRHARPYIRQIQQLAPTVVADDDVGRVAKLLEIVAVRATASAR
jgi:acetylornithine/succinyldiaminopimelate/putrescine aminotransferase